MPSLSWDQLCQTLDDHSTILLDRSADVQKLLNAHMAYVRDTYEIPSDFIKVYYFQFDKRKTNRDKWVACQTPNSHTMVWTTNLFPYALREPIQHYVLWSLAPLTDETIHDTLKPFLARKGNPAYRLLHQDSNGTFPDIWHCHVFVFVHSEGYMR